MNSFLLARLMRDNNNNIEPFIISLLCYGDNNKVDLSTMSIFTITHILNNDFKDNSLFTIYILNKFKELCGDDVPDESADSFITHLLSSYTNSKDIFDNFILKSNYFKTINPILHTLLFDKKLLENELYKKFLISRSVTGSDVYFKAMYLNDLMNNNNKTTNKKKSTRRKTTAAKKETGKVVKES